MAGHFRETADALRLATRFAELERVSIGRLTKDAGDRLGYHYLAQSLILQGRCRHLLDLIPIEFVGANGTFLAALVEAAVADLEFDRALSLARAATPVVAMHPPMLRALDLLRRTEQELSAAPHPLADHVRVIALVGQSYCGSTLLGTMLGSLSDAGHFGETHRLTKRGTADDTGLRNTNFNFSNDNPLDLTPCEACGPDCHLFDFEFRRRLSRDPINWFYKLAAASGKRIVVSSDKHYCARLDPLGRYDVIVLFKSPLNSYRSFWSRHVEMPHLEGYRTSPMRHARSFISTYGKQLDSQCPRGRHVFLSWEHFVAAPAHHFRLLCEQLGLAFESGVVEHPRRGQHVFGGNRRTNSSLKSSDGQLVIKNQLPTTIPVEHVDYFSKSDTTAVHERLLARHHAVFGT